MATENLSAPLIYYSKNLHPSFQLKSNETRKIVAEDDLRHRMNEALEICPERVDTKRSLKVISNLLERNY